MSRMRKLIIIKTVICVAVCAWFDFVINCCTTVERLRLTQQKCEGEKHPQSSKIKHSHIQIFTFEMLIVEWTTVTFRSASLLTNKYREGGGLFSENALHFTTVVSVYTQIQFWNSICSNHKKKVVSKKKA